MAINVNSKGHRIYDADTDEILGYATEEQVVASDAAPGGAGIFVIDKDGAPVAERTSTPLESGERLVYTSV